MNILERVVQKGEARRSSIALFKVTQLVCLSISLLLYPRVLSICCALIFFIVGLNIERGRILIYLTDTNTQY